MNDQVEIRDKPDDPPRRETRPPAKWRGHTYHWLLRVTGDPFGPHIAVWSKSNWLTPGGGNPCSPATMYAMGLRWYAPARPPKHPHRDATERNDNVR